MRIVLLVGLPGSGKSTLGIRLSAALGMPFHDDVSMAFSDFRILLDRGGDAIVADCPLCDPDVLDRALDILAEYGAEVTVLSFENAPEKCLRNVEARNDGRKVRRFIEQYAKAYRPRGTLLPVVTGRCPGEVGGRLWQTVREVLGGR